MQHRRLEDDKPDATVICRCGGTVYAYVGRPGRVEHSVPTCKPFRDLEPVPFLRYVRGLQ